MCQIIHSKTGSIPADLTDALAAELRKNKDGAGAMLLDDSGDVHTVK